MRLHTSRVIAGGVEQPQPLPLRHRQPLLQPGSPWGTGLGGDGAIAMGSEAEAASSPSSSSSSSSAAARRREPQRLRLPAAATAGFGAPLQLQLRLQDSHMPGSPAAVPPWLEQGHYRQAASGAAGTASVPLPSSGAPSQAALTPPSGASAVFPGGAPSGLASAADGGPSPPGPSFLYKLSPQPAEAAAGSGPAPRQRRAPRVYGAAAAAATAAAAAAGVRLQGSHTAVSTSLLSVQAAAALGQGGRDDSGSRLHSGGSSAVFLLTSPFAAAPSSQQLRPALAAPGAAHAAPAAAPPSHDVGEGEGDEEGEAEEAEAEVVLQRLDFTQQAPQAPPAQGPRGFVRGPLGASASLSAHRSAAYPSAAYQQHAAAASGGGTGRSGQQESGHWDSGSRGRRERGATSGGTGAASGPFSFSSRASGGSGSGGSVAGAGCVGDAGSDSGAEADDAAFVVPSSAAASVTAASASGSASSALSDPSALGSASSPEASLRSRRSGSVADGGGRELERGLAAANAVAAAGLASAPALASAAHTATGAVSGSLQGSLQGQVAAIHAASAAAAGSGHRSRGGSQAHEQPLSLHLLPAFSRPPAAAAAAARVAGAAPFPASGRSPEAWPHGVCGGVGATGVRRPQHLLDLPSLPSFTSAAGPGLGGPAAAGGLFGATSILAAGGQLVLGQEGSALLLRGSDRLGTGGTAVAAPARAPPLPLLSAAFPTPDASLFTPYAGAAGVVFEYTETSLAAPGAAVVGGTGARPAAASRRPA
jgi:hypothetical protein